MEEKAHGCDQSGSSLVALVHSWSSLVDARLSSRRQVPLAKAVTEQGARDRTAEDTECACRTYAPWRRLHHEIDKTTCSARDRSGRSGFRAADRGIRRHCRQSAVYRQHRFVQSGQRPGHQRPGRIQGLGFRQGFELPDGSRVPRQRTALRNLRAGVRPRPPERLQRSERGFPGGRLRCEQPVHARYSRLRRNREFASQAREANRLGHGPDRRPAVRRSIGRYRLQQRLPGWNAVRHRFQSGDSRHRPEQQLTHRDGRPAERQGHAVHHRPSHRRSSHRATRIQERMDLLVAGLDDQQRRGRTGQQRRQEPAGHSLPGHRPEQ